MNILVLNGSPKGDQSITLQHIHYVRAVHPAHQFKIINIAQSINKIEKYTERLEEIIWNIRSCDVLIWAFPVYYALVPSQMKRFIELLFEKAPLDKFRGKFATAFTTSIRFFDHTAHNHIQSVSQDLGFTYIKGYSAHMDDFFDEQERTRMVTFYRWFLEMSQSGVIPVPKYPPAVKDPEPYEPGPVKEQPVLKGPGVVILTDTTGQDTSLEHMTDTFIKTTSLPAAVHNIHDAGMKHGCTGCCLCGYDNQCRQKDGFAGFFNSVVMPAEIIIIAGTIKDQYLSADWKKFFDRSFFNGHTPIFAGKRLGFILSGGLQQRQNLRETLEALADNWKVSSCHFVTSEGSTAAQVTADISAFARSIEKGHEQNLVMPPTFYSTGGLKLFRDFIYNASAVFKKDHKFYKKQGIYSDFPQRQIRRRLSNAFFSFLLSIGPVRKQIHLKFIPGMVAPYKKKLKKLTGGPKKP
jgi:multimeric flavodoxin WrbA